MVQSFSGRSGWCLAGAAVRCWPLRFPTWASVCLGVSLAFGLTVLTMAFAIGHISGCHLNPAVSVGLWAGGRFPANQLLPYIVAQVLGAIVAGGVLYLIASGKAGFNVSAGFASNGYGAHSPGGYSLLAALVTEVVMTMMFLLIILGCDRQTCTARLRADRNRPGSYIDSLDQYSGDEYLRKSCPQHGCGLVCRRLGGCAVVAVLGGPNRRRLPWRGHLSVHRCLGKLIGLGGSRRTRRKRPAADPHRWATSSQPASNQKWYTKPV